MQQVNETNFEQEVLNSEKPVLVDFSAVWCGACRQIAPFLEQIAEEMKSEVKLVQVDVDEAEALAMKYDVQSLPTLIMFKNQKATATQIGALSQNELVSWIKSNI